jgi:thiol-disulfide isomerase/thioredoxin
VAKGLRRVVNVLLVLVIVAGLGAAYGWRFLEHRLRERMQPPVLESQPQPAVDLVYRTLNGQERHLADAKGQVVFLNLWGTWCIQCVAEMPSVQELYDHYQGDPQVKFLIVSRLDKPTTVRSYALRKHFTLPFYVTQDADIPQSMQFNQYPVTFIFAKDGTLVAKHVGAADWSDRSVVAFLNQLKTQSTSPFSTN